MIGHVNSYLKIINNQVIYKFEWISDENDKLDITVPVKGIYRLTLISLTKFDITSSNSVGVNNTISTIIDKDKPEQFAINNNTVIRLKIPRCLEFITEI